MEIPPAVTMWLLTTYEYISAFYTTTSHLAGILFTSVINAFEPPIYYFFDTLTPTQPYRSIYVNENASSSAKVDWTYNFDAKHFFEGIGCSYSLHHRAYPYLSIELIESSGRVAYDLTDFVEGLQIYSDSRSTPSIGHIIAAWSIGSHIVLSPDVIHSVRLMDENGNPCEMSYEAAVNGEEPVVVTEDETNQLATDDLTAADLSGSDLSGNANTSST
jgi:hypothetical protein